LKGERNWRRKELDEKGHSKRQSDQETNKRKLDEGGMGRLGRGVGRKTDQRGKKANETKTKQENKEKKEKVILKKRLKRDGGKRAEKRETNRTERQETAKARKRLDFFFIQPIAVHKGRKPRLWQRVKLCDFRTQALLSSARWCC
jgi:hypothetical protein